MSDIIKSYSFSQEEIIKNILFLYSKGNKIDCDPTYSKGNFYKNTGIEKPKYKFDISPVLPEVQRASADNLKDFISDNQLLTIMFDPPFLATTGKSITEKKEGNIINKRFGVFPNEKSLHSFYISAMKEFYRILKEEDGILIFKCQDKVSSSKQYLSHVFIIQEAIKIGFYPKDIFILLAKNRIIAKWQRNQQHSRKFHSYFIVLKKNKKKIRYI